jgi:hypothetical protein
MRASTGCAPHFHYPFVNLVREVFFNGNWNREMVQ